MCFSGKTTVAIRGAKRVFVDFLTRKEFVFQCNVTSDPSTPPTLHWNKTEPYNDLVHEEPPYVYVKNEFLIIMFPPNCSSDCAKYLGEYKCSGYNGRNLEMRSITISYRPSTGKYATCNYNLVYSKTMLVHIRV